MLMTTIAWKVKQMVSWEEILPNTMARAKETFMKRCKEDPEFRQEMIEKGVLVLEDES